MAGAFDSISVSHLRDVADIDGIPYPPPITPITLPVGAIPVGTGALPPLQDSGIKVIDGIVDPNNPPVVLPGRLIDFDPANPESAVVGYLAGIGLIMRCKEGQIILYDDSVPKQDAGIINQSGGLVFLVAPTATGAAGIVGGLNGSSVIAQDSSVSINAAGATPLVINVAGSSGAPNQVLMSDGTNATWQNAPAGNPILSGTYQQTNPQTVPASTAVVQVTYDSMTTELVDLVLLGDKSTFQNNANQHKYSITAQTSFSNSIGNVSGSVYYQFWLQNFAGIQGRSGESNPPNGFALTQSNTTVITMAPGAQFNINTQMFGSGGDDVTVAGDTKVYITQLT
jgi:hypothetical protein